MNHQSHKNGNYSYSQKDKKTSARQRLSGWRTQGHHLFCQALKLAWKTGHPDSIKVIIDSFLILMGAAWIWFVSYSQVPHPGKPWPFLGVVLVARLLLYFLLRLHRQSWLNVSRYEVFVLAVSALLGPFFIAALFYILPQPFTLRALLRPELILITEPAIYLLLLCSVRISSRALSKPPFELMHKQRILIIGAYDAGRALAFQIQESSPDHCNYHVVGFVDDDSRLWGRRVRGIPVLGTLKKLEKWTKFTQAQEIVIANHDLPPKKLRYILEIGTRLNLPVRMLPRLRELMGTTAGIDSLRKVRMEDLLARPEIKLDKEALSSYLNGRVILVTGGGGSIGGELCRQVVTSGAKQLIVLGRGENSVFEMVQELKTLTHACKIIPAICDVRDRRALEGIFRQFHPEVVFHAAAHKHVPLMEQYPCEAVKNNIAGTLNVIELTLQEQTRQFVMVSTDKAVDPSSVMGASKRIGEMLVKGYAKQSNANMVCVRFGNVLGSRGSVVPTMIRQIEQGLPVTVTDPDMVRYFMTIPEAVQLVLQAGSVGGNGDVFVLNMGQPVRIMDLAYDLIRLSGLVPYQDIPINIIGIRPGEKMYEDILTEKEESSLNKKGDFIIAHTQPIDMRQFSQSIKELIEVAEKGDATAVVKLIKQIVPEFGVTSSKGPRAALSPSLEQDKAQLELSGDVSRR